MHEIKIVVEQHTDGFIAYPLGIDGVVVGEGKSYEAALEDVKSAIRFHVETFGPEVLSPDPPVLDAFLAATSIEV
jgi:predicted RNase H-like HicB family nuclease